MHKLLGKKLTLFILIVLLSGVGVLAWTSNRPTVLPAASPAIEAQVALTIDSGTGQQAFQVAISGETSAADLLLAAASQNNFSVDTKDYGGELGLFIEAINSLRGDATVGKYWIFYINGKTSQTGASSTFVKPGDSVLWKYEAMRDGL